MDEDETQALTRERLARLLDDISRAFERDYFASFIREQQRFIDPPPRREGHLAGRPHTRSPAPSLVIRHQTVDAPVSPAITRDNLTTAPLTGEAVGRALAEEWVWTVRHEFTYRGRDEAPSRTETPSPAPKRASSTPVPVPPETQLKLL